MLQIRRFTESDPHSLKALHARNRCDDAFVGRGLEIRFGSWPNSHITEGDIGLEVASALQRQGLKVSWDGGRVTPIRIAMDWRKRRLQGF